VRAIASTATPAECAPLNGIIWTNDDARIIGYAGLSHIDATRRQAKLRFWIGSEIPRVDFAFTILTLHRVYALQLARQPRLGHIRSGIDCLARYRAVSRAIESTTRRAPLAPSAAASAELRSTLVSTRPYKYTT
jgi:hypothetical protein